jgi:hypothetical protein
MRINKKPILLFSSFFFLALANAQLEAAHLSAKGFSSYGFVAFFNVGYPVTRGDMITEEGDVGYFAHAVMAVPLSFGYRHTFNGKGDGFYIEPHISYTLGASDLPRADSAKSAAGKDRINQPDLNGLTAGLGFGYIFPGNFAFNLGLEYEYIFVAGDPKVNILSLRLSHIIICGKRKHR